MSADNTAEQHDAAVRERATARIRAQMPGTEDTLARDERLVKWYLLKKAEDRIAELERMVEAGRKLSQDIQAANAELASSDGIAYVKPVHMMLARCAFALVAYDKALGGDDGNR